MSEPIKVFGLDDYQHYFASSSLSTEAGTETSEEITVSSPEAAEVVLETETESGTLQNIEVNTQSMVNISIVSVIALGLLIGVQMGKVFLDKIWR